MPTENRDYNLPQEGETDWHVPVNENWQMIDSDVQAALDAAYEALNAATDSTTSEPDSTDTGGGTGFTWDQTHVDTSWLSEADANGTLTVEKVTTLDPDGDGSLTAALDAARDNEATIVVFEVGGVIDNGGDIWIRSEADNVYIAGQTAPYPGITMVRGGIRVHGDNTIISHLSLLPGDDTNSPKDADCINGDDDTNNLLFDHCLFGWSTDVNVVFHPGAQNQAVINSINAEALNDSSHPEAPHGYGLNIRGDAGPLAYMGNLHAHIWKRNPKPNSGKLVMANNYMYNWGDRVQHGGDSSGEVDWIANVIEAGGDTDTGSGIFDGDPGQVYWENNQLNPSDTPLEDGDIDYSDSSMNLPGGLSVSDLVDPSDLESFIAPMVGPRPANRDPVAQRMVDEFVNREGRIIDHHDDVGGYPSYSPTSRSLSPPSDGVLDWLQSYTDEVELGA